MFDRSLTVLGVDSVDPILIGLMGRLGRQPVDQELFGGAAIPDAVAEVDRKPADAGHPLDSGKLRLALLQRAVRLVALTSDLFQMLPQPLGGCGFRKGV